jgi:hypothetical protein
VCSFSIEVAARARSSPHAPPGRARSFADAASIRHLRDGDASWRRRRTHPTDAPFFRQDTDGKVVRFRSDRDISTAESGARARGAARRFHSNLDRATRVDRGAARSTLE